MRHLYTNRLVYLMAVILFVAVLIFAAISLQSGRVDDAPAACAVAPGEVAPRGSCGSDSGASIDTWWGGR